MKPHDLICPLCPRTVGQEAQGHRRAVGQWFTECAARPSLRAGGSLR